MRNTCDIKVPRYVNVGIMSDKRISFSLNGTFSDGNEPFTGEQTATAHEGKILWHGKTANTIELVPMDKEATFTLKDVTIGKQFHWERKEQETFCGTLRIIPEGDELTAINHINIEDYLVSVISSEMSATSSLEYLRSQAVVSRSWLVRILLSRINGKPMGSADHAHGASQDSNREQIIKWYENDAHTNFDVCADDHCQRYEGITRAQSQTVREAVLSTCGEVLTHNGAVCDARFSKCCGGVSERFSSCWDEHDEEYLSPVRDCPDSMNGSQFPNLADEKEAEKWISSSPESFCNTHDKDILSQVLNDYDFETKDFYRWEAVYTQDELATLISRKLNTDFGKIKSITPGKRGASGRLITLHICGTRRCVTIGKELEIRRALSPTHLMSSAFTVTPLEISDEGIPARFKITGAGWGHGVGMCQIGAAVMAAKNYDYKTILKHYYKNSEITKLYD